MSIKECCPYGSLKACPFREDEEHSEVYTHHQELALVATKVNELAAGGDQLKPLCPAHRQQRQCLFHTHPTQKQAHNQQFSHNREQVIIFDQTHMDIDEPPKDHRPTTSKVMGLAFAIFVLLGGVTIGALILEQVSPFAPMSNLARQISGYGSLGAAGIAGIGALKLVHDMTVIKRAPRPLGH